MKIACIIPAYNEASRIGGVLNPVVRSKNFSRVIVVDDGSTDSTATIAGSYPGVELYKMGENRGKSTAVGVAINYLNESVDFVCLLDADLIGLTIHNLDELVRPIHNGYDATLSLRRSYGGLFRPDLDIFTGERVVPLNLLKRGNLPFIGSMEMEMAINRELIMVNAKIIVVPWPNVTNPTKSTKYGWWDGVKKDYRMFQELRKFGGVRTVVRQRMALRRQVV